MENKRITDRKELQCASGNIYTAKTIRASLNSAEYVEVFSTYMDNIVLELDYQDLTDFIHLLCIMKRGLKDDI